MNVVHGLLGRTARNGLCFIVVLAALSGSAIAGGGVPPSLSVPEIDPGSIGSALTLLIGGAYWLTGRSRKG
jgi:hypothetical protein